MEKGFQEESDLKSNLVTQICFLSSLSNGCVHTRQSSPFIDWYRLLGVEETAGVDIIRKKYHKLALQLHPDKNKHPKADIAFKLVSEAHACLADSAKKRAFDMERWRNFCFQCNAGPVKPDSPKHKPWSGPGRSRSHRFLRGLKDLRDKFRDETKVIERCMKVNAANASPRKESPPPIFSPLNRLLRSQSHRVNRKESPIFDPSDYAFAGYPHVRNQVEKKIGGFWNLGQAREKCDSPIFEMRSDCRVFKSRTACVYS